MLPQSEGEIGEVQGEHSDINNPSWTGGNVLLDVDPVEDKFLRSSDDSDNGSSSGSSSDSYSSSGDESGHDSDGEQVVEQAAVQPNKQGHNLSVPWYSATVMSNMGNILPDVLNEETEMEMLRKNPLVQKLLKQARGNSHNSHEVLPQPRKRIRTIMV